MGRISSGGTFSTLSLAQEFGVSKELVEAMLADLARMGLLKDMARCGESSCAHCGIASSCSSRGKTWMTR